MASDYTDRAQVRAYLGLATAATGDDALIDDFIQRASRFVDRYTRRFFYALTQTRYQDNPDSYTRLYLGADLLSCTTLTVDSSAVDSGDFHLYPANGYPKLWIEAAHGSGQLFTWSTSPQRNVAIAGIWGYHDDYDNAWRDPSDTIQDAGGITAAATTLDVTDGTKFAVRQTLLCESEQLGPITAISSNTITVSGRGLNGTTASTHANGTAIKIWQMPYDIEHVAIRLATWFYKQRKAPFQKTANPQLGTVVVPTALPEDIRAMLNPYRRVP